MFYNINGTYLINQKFSSQFYFNTLLFTIACCSLRLIMLSDYISQSVAQLVFLIFNDPGAELIDFTENKVKKMEIIRVKLCI